MAITVVDQTDHIRSVDHGRVFAILLSSIMGVMMVAAINPALPTIAAHFQAGNDQAEFYSRLALLLPAIFIAIASPIAGLLADTVGRRPVYLGAAALYGVMGTACIFSPNLYVMIGLRLLQGLGTAGMVTVAAILCADYFRGEARMKIIGWQAASITGGGAVMLLLSGVLAEAGWRTPFFLYGGVAVLTLVVGWTTIGEPAIRRGPELGKGSLGTMVRMAGGLSLVCGALLFLPPIHAPFLMEGIGISSPAWIAVGLATLNTVAAIAAMLFPRFAKYGFGAVLVGCLAFGAAGASLLGVATSFAGVLAGMALMGVAVGVVFPALQGVAMNFSTAETRARAISFVLALTFVGEALSPLLSEPVKQALGLPGLFQAGAVLLAGLAVLCVALKFGSGTAAEKAHG